MTSPVQATSSDSDISPVDRLMKYRDSLKPWIRGTTPDLGTVSKNPVCFAPMRLPPSPPSGEYYHRVPKIAPCDCDRGSDSDSSSTPEHDDSCPQYISNSESSTSTDVEIDTTSSQNHDTDAEIDTNSSQNLNHSNDWVDAKSTHDNTQADAKSTHIHAHIMHNSMPLLEQIPLEDFPNKHPR